MLKTTESNGGSEEVALASPSSSAPDVVESDLGTPSTGPLESYSISRPEREPSLPGEDDLIHKKNKEIEELTEDEWTNMLDTWKSTWNEGAIGRFLRVNEEYEEPLSMRFSEDVYTTQHAVAETPDASAVAVIQPSLRDRLKALYSRYNPQKTEADFDRVLERFEGDENMMFR